MVIKEEKRKAWTLKSFAPFLLLLVALPAAMVLWVGNLAFSKFRDESLEAIPPTRWLTATLLPLAFASWGYRRKSVNRSGALAGLVIAFLLTLASYGFTMDLIIFFVTSSQASKFKKKRKEKIAEDFVEGAQRNWIQAVCNGGAAALLAILYLFDSGSGEHPIDFTQDFRSSWLSTAILGAFACANADTWASELGTVLSKDDPFLITTGVKVPKGVNGGVSWVGLVLSAAGGLAVGIGRLLVLRLSALPGSPPQWPVVPLAMAAGFIGSLIDSFLGATLQYSGWDKKKGVVTETPGPEVKYICGHRVLDNNSVNILSTIITALLTPRIAAALWPR